MADPSYQRQPPPFLLRCMVGAVIDGVVNPVAWAFEKIGQGDRLFRKSYPWRIRRLQKLKPFSDYHPGKQDVVVATYPKSGTNWAMQIVTQLAWHGKADFDHIHCIVPWPDPNLLGPMKSFAVPIHDDSTWRASPEQKRAVKTHLNWEFIPYSEHARYVLVIRDPKDVFVSGFYFFKESVLGRTVSTETWIKLFQSDDFPVGGCWARNAAGYWAERHRPNVLVLSFKAMKQDLEASVRKIAAFMDTRLSEDAIRAVCEKSSFGYMKRFADKFGMWDLIPWRKHSSVIRRGVHGGASEVLSIQQRLAMDAHFMNELQRLRSDLPYEDFADVTPGAQEMVGGPAPTPGDFSP